MKRIGYTVCVNFLLVIAVCLGFAANATAEIDESQYDVIYFDDFTTNTLYDYTYQSNLPLNFFTYNAEREALKLVTGDNRHVYVLKDIPVTVQDGYFEIEFYPYKKYPFDGITEIMVMSEDGDYYHWHFSRDTNRAHAGNWQQYRARVHKYVNGSSAFFKIFTPSPVDSYSLNAWHTMGMKFDPTGMTVNIDNTEIATFEDPNQTPIQVSTIRVVFRQQDQYLGYVKLLGFKDTIAADIDIDPDTLNLKSSGRVITCYIELPTNDVTQVDVATVQLADGPLALIDPSNVDDYDEDGNPDIMVKFDRQQVIDYILQNEIEDGQELELTVQGKIYDGTKFEGSDVIRVLKKENGKKK